MNYDAGSDSFALMDEQQIKFHRRKWSMWGKQQRHKQFHRKGLCSFCQTHKATTLDHIIPRNRPGGEDRNDPMNYASACYECNQMKGDKHFLIFWAWRQDVVVQGCCHTDSMMRV